MAAAGEAGGLSLAGDLTQDYDAHAPFAFEPVPATPPWANVTARMRRWFAIALAESWLAVLLYRAKMRFRASHVPVLPTLCDLLSRSLFHISIGNHVQIGPGLMITHGNVVIDGRTTIGRHCQINPWVTIGLSNSRRLGFSVVGPAIGDEVHIGTGAKILGPIRIGDHVRIGANAVVVHDVPSHSTVVGVPARPVDALRARREARADGQHLTHVMRSAIAGYRRRQRTLQSLVEVLNSSFAAGHDGLRSTSDAVMDDVVFLEAVAATGGDETPQVLAAVDAIERALSAEAA